ncbi:unannotated protein [freshwater metagenome]|uniref:Unannotated protein n=1 Tax=freshwater metagenome TaxID=449393 RepID=A0A6J7F905_9ZZZZ|nr:aminotransferase class I/II-fold pyridoxal phosphate-dependent enzyme [Actinomycetota bacterium]
MTATTAGTRTTAREGTTTPGPSRATTADGPRDPARPATPGVDRTPPPVRFLDLVPPAALRDELEGALLRVARSGRYLLGPELEAFEHEFAAFAGARHCVAVGSGLDALTLALRARGIGPGDEVLVPGQTFVATWLAVTAAGATVVPVDVAPGTHLMDVDAACAAIGPRTAAIVPVDLYGHPAPHPELRALCDAHGLWLLDDAAQAHGARLHGRPAGSWADAAAWSFYPGKNLGAMGDGGAVTTDDADLARRLRRLRNYGSEQKYVHLEAGANSRLDELQAAVLRVRLRALPAANAHRTAVAAAYGRGLADLAAAGRVGLPVVTAGAEPSHHLHVLRSPHRDALRDALDREGVPTLVHYPTPPARQPAFAGLAAARASLPEADRAAAEVLSLPMGPHLTADEVGRVVAAVCRAVLAVDAGRGAVEGRHRPTGRAVADRRAAVGRSPSGRPDARDPSEEFRLRPADHRDPPDHHERGVRTAAGAPR